MWLLLPKSPDNPDSTYGYLCSTYLSNLLLLRMLQASNQVAKQTLLRTEEILELAAIAGLFLRRGRLFE